MPLITVILPSLNVAGYIEQTLESVCTQTYEKLEILAVDAGSTDGTWEILQKWRAKDERITVISSPRKSYGYQVNLGLVHAHGEYIAVVETDDFIKQDMLEKLLGIAILTGADYVKGDYEDIVPLSDGSFWSDAVCCLTSDRQLYHKVITPIEHPELIRRDIYYWRGIYRKEFLDRNHIRLNESDGAAFQDAGFLFQTLGLAQKAVYVNQSVYHYRRGNVNASIYHPQGFHFLDNEYAYIEQTMEKQHKEQFKIIKPYYYGRLFDQCAGRVRTMASQGGCWDGIEDAVHNIWRRISEGYENGMLDSGIMGTSLWKEVMMFLDNTQQYMTYQMCIYNGKRRMLYNLLQTLRRGHQIVIYSCGRLARFACCLVRMNDIEVEAFCDNNMMKWHTKCMNREVLSVEEAADRYSGALFLIANNHYSPVMKKQLISLGIPEKNICMFDLEYDLLLLNM